MNILTTDDGWLPPNHSEYRVIPVEFLLHNVDDRRISALLNKLNEAASTLMSEGAKTIEFQWRNVIDREENPDGVMGTVLVKATR